MRNMVVRSHQSVAFQQHVSRSRCLIAIIQMPELAPPTFYVSATELSTSGGLIVVHLVIVRGFVV